MNFSETKTEIFQADADTKLLVYEWLPQSDIQAVLIGLHGGLAHGGDWVTPALYFREKGVATYAPDLRHHGTYDKHNPGGKNFFHIESYDVYTRDVHKIYEWVKARHPGKPIFIISHSNGALISLYYGLTLGKKEDIRGFIISSPWLVNRVKISAVLKKISKVIAVLYPTFSIKPPSLTDQLTRDAAITRRHHEDEKSGLRGSKVTAKLGVESEKTQAWVLANLRNWNMFSLFAVIAGDDQLADAEASQAALKTIAPQLLTMVVHADNYHENFNEINRDETFAAIWAWMEERIAG
ncbi:MAG: alpha/beta fold hydrolase [Thermodesulfobacteriota bacterium]